MNRQTITNRIKTSLLWLCGILAPLPWGGVGGGLLTSCSEWDDHYESTQGGSDITLMQLMKADSELSDFCQVLEQTKVFRMHKRTSVSYADLLGSGGQSFTVVAPKNGTFNRDSLLNLVKTDRGDSIVEKFFVLNHISRSATSVRAAEQQMLLLNQKHVAVGGNTIHGVNVLKPNCHAKNGIVHVVERPLNYDLNLYEALCDLPEMSTIGSLLRVYDEDYFDADNSVSIGIVEGVPVYVDSVVIERNRMLQKIGLINNEDSMYYVVAPTLQGWEKAWNEASKYFVYDKTVLKSDSIQQYWTNRALLDDAIFNLTDQKSEQDSLVSVPYLDWRKTWTSGKPIFHLFLNPYSANGILHGAESVKCSNGTLYKVAEWPFTPEQTYFKEIWSEGENTSLIIGEKECSYNTRRQVGDSISENGYLQIIPARNTSNWELTFRVKNTLSANYDICAIILPKTVAGESAEGLNPCKFKATVNYVDENGVEKTYNNDGATYQTNPLKVDTIVLAENFYLPACNYDQSDIKVSVRMQCYILARETAKFSREMYLDCIYLRPRNNKQ